MKIKNSTYEAIVILCDGKEILCHPWETILISTNQNEIYIKSAEEAVTSSHFKIFKHIGKDSIKGNVTYLNPGFFLKYLTKVTVNSNVNEISVKKFDLAIHSLIICRFFTVDENHRKKILIEKKITQNLLLMFVLLWAVPCCVATGLLALISVLGIFFDFDWSLVLAAVLLLLFLFLFIGLFKSLYRCTKPDKFYSKILKDGKTVIIKENQKHLISYIETQENTD